jgi:LysR family transcriptional regulator, glycine cleavage system transcriptional activator
VELHVSPSAVSHAISKLETSLGVTLFDRAGRAVRLSVEGETLLRHTQGAFTELARGIDIVSTRVPRLLRLHSSPSFAAQWLSPRLPRFLAGNPGIQVRLAANADTPEFLSEEFDAEIAYGRKSQDGIVQLSLGEETIAPLCAPSLAAEVNNIDDLCRFMLIESDRNRVRWPEWFEANGLSAPAPQGLRFDRSFLAIAAAADGLGIALESTRLAEREICSGKLAMPLAGKSENVTHLAHFLVYRLRPVPHVRAFETWLLEELGIEGSYRR